MCACMQVCVCMRVCVGVRGCVVGVLWVCCGCAVGVLWVCCGCAVGVLWVCCGCAVGGKKLLHGVHEDSVLGPLLFNIYFNDFSTNWKVQMTVTMQIIQIYMHVI